MMWISSTILGVKIFLTFLLLIGSFCGHPLTKETFLRFQNTLKIVIKTCVLVPSLIDGFRWWVVSGMNLLTKLQ